MENFTIVLSSAILILMKKTFVKSFHFPLFHLSKNRRVLFIKSGHIGENPGIRDVRSPESKDN